MGTSRATATVLFTDLVGSTELRTRLGEGAAEELRRVHDRLLAQAVETHAGRVVKGLGDGIMASFAAASDAVAAAVAIQQAVDRHNRGADPPAALAVRVGISLGDVTFEDDDVHGTPVIEAARLCAVAAGGQILASDLVRALAGTAGSGAFGPVGPLSLKGLPEPVAACDVTWEPLAMSPIPMPSLLTDVGRVFVGREDQLERLGQLWKEAAAGERRVALLAGEPGVGKTRLAAELAARVFEEGATVLAGRCDEDLGMPYQPFVEALRQYVDHTPAADLEGRLGRYGGELTRLIPELPAQVPGLPPAVQSDPETERYRLFDAVAAWLGAASAADALLLVLDDLQWAAKPTTDARYRFAHALVRDTLYSGLSAARRVTLHRRVAEAIETVHAAALDNHLPALAHHWARAAAPAAETARAVDYAARAGDQALAQLANDEAVRYYRQALDLLGLVEGGGNNDRRLELLIGLGEAQRRASDPASRTTLLDAGQLARRLGRGEAMARAALANSRGTFSELGVIDTDRVRALEEALAASGDADPAQRARLLAILAVELLWSADPARCRRLSDEALALARQTGDPRVLGSVIALRWATFWDPGWAVERLHLAEELLSLAEVTGDPSFRFWALWRRSLALMELGDAAAAGEFREAARRQAEDLGQPFPRLAVVYSQIPAAVAAGRLTDAETGIEAIRDSRIPDIDTLYTAGLAGVRYEYGRLGELLPVLQSTVERLPRVPLFRALLALAYTELGRMSEARATYTSMGQDPAELVFDYFAAPTAAVLATVCAQLGDTGGAARLLELLTPVADQIASHPGMWFGAYSHHLGLLARTLGRASEAEAYFRAAAATHERLGATTWVTRTRMEWANTAC